MSAIRTASIFISLIAVVFILIEGQGLIIPLVLATILWALVREIKQGINKSRFIRDKLPNWIKNLSISAVIIGIIGGLFQILIASTKAVTKSYNIHKSNIDLITNNINEIFEIDISLFLNSQLSDFNFTNLLSGMLNGLTGILGSTFMILLYVLFIFLEEANFSGKMKIIFKDKQQYNQLVNVLESIEDNVTKYLGLKIFVSLLTGLFSYLILIFIGVDGPVFWSFLIFILNFIPTIGSLVATLFPVIFSVLQFGDFSHGLTILVLLGSVQLLVGNIIEPRIMGNNLNLSSLVAIFSLMFWGAIWGVTGMLLSIPITVILTIILSQFPKTRNLAILLSKDGNL